MKISFKEYKAHILLAIVAAILVPYLFEPILNLLGKAFIYIGNSVASNYLDSLYRDIASGKSDYFLNMSSGFFLGIAIVIFTLPLRVGNPKKSKKLINQEIADSRTEQTSPEVTAEEKAKSTSLYSKLLFGLVCIFVSFVTFAIVISSTIKFSTINSFEQRIKILTPYISINEKDILISKFAAMNSYHEYLALNEEIKSIAKAKNVILPKQSYISLY